MLTADFHYLVWAITLALWFVIGLGLFKGAGKFMEWTDRRRVKRSMGRVWK